MIRTTKNRLTAPPRVVTIVRGVPDEIACVMLAPQGMSAGQAAVWADLAAATCDRDPEEVKSYLLLKGFTSTEVAIA